MTLRPERIEHDNQEALAMIRAYIDENGYAPSLGDIAERLGLRSRSTAQRRVGALVDLGWITAGKHPRSIVVRTDTKTDAVDL